MKPRPALVGSVGGAVIVAFNGTVAPRSTIMANRRTVHAFLRDDEV
ncbi:hypothetical protein [Streptomyces dysideae]|nr:hypothetical protein [Streptomyces dysideae]